MTVNSAGGCKFYIGSAASGTPSLAGLQADSYTEVFEVEDIGEFGDESQPINFTSLRDSRVRKFKGPRDAGTLAVIVGDDPNDAGQSAMVTAEASPNNFNFKVELNDPISLSGTSSTHYFVGQVMSKRLNVGNASNVVRRTFNVGVNSEIFEVDPT